MAHAGCELVKGKDGEGDGSSRCDLERDGAGKTERRDKVGRGRGKQDEREGTAIGYISAYYGYIFITACVFNYPPASLYLSFHQSFSLFISFPVFLSLIFPYSSFPLSPNFSFKKIQRCS